MSRNRILHRSHISLVERIASMRTNTTREGTKN